MYAFTLHRPSSVRQAANLLAKSEDAKLLAGRHPVKETGQVCFGLESADGVHGRIKLD